MPVNTDFLVIGGGIIGISIANEILNRYPNSKVTIIEKENQIGLHASGRNSGVLHAGFYYSEDSLKAKLTSTGNTLMTNYCIENNLPIRKCGKFVVAQNCEEEKIISMLAQRAKNNNVKVEKISENDARKLEPNIKTSNIALYSPNTAVVDPKSVVQSMLQRFKEKKGKVLFNTKYLSTENNHVVTTNGTFSYGFLINSAGLYADSIAQDFELSEDYYLLPFKGLYIKSDKPLDFLKSNIYPVPNLRNPFLGIHFTKTISGEIKIGPTAIPAFWRENYSGLDNFKLREFFDISSKQLSLLINSKFDFKRIAFSELSNYYKPNILRKAEKLCKNFKKDDFQNWYVSGIRAQLVSKKNKNLVMDFIIEKRENSLHILNAVSPAFTSSLSFANYVLDIMEDKDL